MFNKSKLTFVERALTDIMNFTNKKDIIKGSISINNKNIYYICPREQLNNVNNYLKFLKNRYVEGYSDDTALCRKKIKRKCIDINYQNISGAFSLFGNKKIFNLVMKKL